MQTQHLFTAGRDASDFLYRSDTGIIGTLEEGTLPADISRIRDRAANELQFNDNPSTANIETFFDTGDGAAYTIHIQDADGVASFAVDGALDPVSTGNVARFDTPAAFDTIISRIAAGDRFILAFTRTVALEVGGAATMPGLSAEGGVELTSADPLEIGGAATMPGFTAEGGVLLRDASTGNQNLRIGDETPDRLYLGGNEVDAVYLGDERVF